MEASLQRFGIFLLLVGIFFSGTSGRSNVSLILLIGGLVVGIVGFGWAFKLGFIDPDL